eukprot:TRINITY_DN1961_c0_g3_i2.p1 TRINITY_DN1961_c0_g3~~TRINITY_DN1961_c0_g3_i2.p1  ORF type:complete len:332 (-),score=15.94 TRINITY_DN1961_c0_g3_i2:109-1104(-)
MGRYFSRISWYYTIISTMQSRKLMSVPCQGYKRFSSLLYCSVVNNPQSVVFFFPGDIQKFSNEMKTSEWKDYCFEDTMTVLSKKYPSSSVVLVQPCRQIGDFSFYDKFYFPGHCLLHLLHLFDSFVLKSKSEHDFNISTSIPIILSGFSRGVLVLNHFLAEWATVDKDSRLILDWQADSNGKAIFKFPQWEYNLSLYLSQAKSDHLFEEFDRIKRFVNQIKAIHYIDGHRFPTSNLVVSSLADLIKKNELQLFVHTSPRQLESEQQTWIIHELELFIQHLEHEKATYIRKHYFANKEKTMEYHFKVLTEFCSSVSTFHDEGGFKHPFKIHK